ncbi:hypothetical protein HAX54_046698 [Datura stramonium]|uniref:CCHC-type domain-containing protein n=1 Tax=Datura stramonium TaxID=4076 RepID=A0ABS8SS00_DATST|nr:hypothetical protein [Datura stramonium]
MKRWRCLFEDSKSSSEKRESRNNGKSSEKGQFQGCFKCGKMDHLIKDCPLLKKKNKGKTRRNSNNWPQKLSKKAMNATWGEISDEELEEDGENENLAFMAKSDTDSDSNSSKQMSVEKVEMSKKFSNLKSNYKVLKREKIESENAIKTLNVEISNLEETVSVQKTKSSKLMETVLSLKAEINTIKEGKTSSSEIIINDQDLQENEEELEIGLVSSSTKQVSGTSPNEEMILETDSLNVPSKPRQELKI